MFAWIDTATNISLPRLKITRAWILPTDLKIIKSFKVFGQVEDLNVDDIVAFQDGKVASSGRDQLISLLKLDPKDIDYELLKKQHEETTRKEVMDDPKEEEMEINNILDDPLNILDEEFLSNFSMETSIDEESEIINGNLRILNAPFDII